MTPIEREAFQPALEQAQHTLEKALEEACGVDLRRMNTGELIRIDETLAVASKAAKEAVSVRLRLRNQRSSSSTERAKTPVKGAPVVGEVRAPEAHRVFDDLTGTRWHAFAVRPSTAAVDRASLPDAFRRGWLSFEAGDQLRRLAPIPAKWEELPIEDLRALCARAEVAPKRTSPPKGQKKPDA